MNLGYMQVESSTDEGTVTVRIHYDQSAPDPQPLVDGPRGYCLDITNTGRQRKLSYTLPDGTRATSQPIGNGDPVSNRSLNVRQMRRAGYSYRSDVAGLTIE